MPIPSPGIPSAIVPISSVELKPTQNNRAFYVYSGEISVGTDETTMISVNDIGKRDILFCLEVGIDTFSGNDYNLRVKSNGETIFDNQYSQGGGIPVPKNKFIIPANTSLEVTLEFASSGFMCSVTGYGYYLEAQ